MTGFDRYLAPARARADLWRIVLGAGIALGAWLGLTAGVVAALSAIVPQVATELVNNAATARSIVAFLSTFLGLHLGVLLAIRLLHGRSYASVLGGPARVLVRNMALASAVMVLLAALPVLLTPLERIWFSDPPQLVRSTPLAVWLGWLLPTALATLVQTSGEEVFFRGYLLQQLAARFRSPLAWAVLPSAGFAALHYNPGLGTNTFFHMGNTLAAGTMLALVTARTGNLGAAIGLHFANNLIGLILVAPRGYLDGMALFTVDAPLTGSYLAYGVTVQTGVEILAFALWWRWSGRRTG